MSARAGQRHWWTWSKTVALSPPTAWTRSRRLLWRERVAWGCLDLSGPYRNTFDDALGDTARVADPFHVVKVAKGELDECRRRAQNETLGDREPNSDPL